MNSLFKSIISNKYLFDRVSYYLHSHCNRFHCKRKRYEIEYINWLIDHSHYDVIEYKLEQYIKNNDVQQKQQQSIQLPFKSSISIKSLCTLASDVTKYSILLSLLSIEYISSNIIPHYEVLESAIKSAPPPPSSSGTNGPYAEYTLINRLIDLYPILLLSKQCYCAAIEINRLDIFKLLIDKYKYYQEIATVYNHNNNNNNNYNNNEIDKPIKFNGIFKDHVLNLGSEITTMAAKKGNVESLKLLNRVQEYNAMVKVYFNSKAIDIASTNGHLVCLKWLLENRPELECLVNTLDETLENNQIDCARLLIESRNKIKGGIECSTKSVVQCVKLNRCDLMDYLIRETKLIKIEDCKFDKQLISEACANPKSLECLKYLLKVVKVTLTDECVYAMATAGNEEALLFLYNKKNTSSKWIKRMDEITALTMENALRAGKLEFVEAMYKCKWISNNQKHLKVDELLRKGVQSWDVASIEYLIKKYPKELTGQVVARIATENIGSLSGMHFNDKEKLKKKNEKVKWYFQNGWIGKENHHLVLPIIPSNFFTRDSFQYLLDNQIEIDQSKKEIIMNNAVCHGELELVKYLHSIHNIICSAGSFKLAAMNNHYPVVEYCLENMPMSKLIVERDIIDSAMICGRFKVAMLLNKFISPPDQYSYYLYSNSLHNQTNQKDKIGYNYNNDQDYYKGMEYEIRKYYTFSIHEPINTNSLELASNKGRLDILDILTNIYYKWRVRNNKPGQFISTPMLMYPDIVSYVLEHYPHTKRYYEDKLWYCCESVQAWGSAGYLIQLIEQNNIQLDMVTGQYMPEILRTCIRFHFIELIHHILSRFGSIISKDIILTAYQYAQEIDSPTKIYLNYYYNN